MTDSRRGAHAPLAPSPGFDSFEAEVVALRAGLKKILDRSRHEQQTWSPDSHHPTEYSRAWRDGFVTSLSTAALIATEALDPIGWAEHQEQWRASSWDSDREWFERTGCCGHCGNAGDNCVCSADDPCGCGPHERATEPKPCGWCKGTGLAYRPEVPA